jgi:hypothetical protein
VGINARRDMLDAGVEPDPLSLDCLLRFVPEATRKSLEQECTGGNGVTDMGVWEYFLNQRVHTARRLGRQSLVQLFIRNPQ